MQELKCETCAKRWSLKLTNEWWCEHLEIVLENGQAMLQHAKTCGGYKKKEAKCFAPSEAESEG